MSTRAAMEWITGRDTGVSSQTIWAVMMGAVSPSSRYDVPHDPSDFGRCYRLLRMVPEWRPRLPEVATRYPKWGPMVEAWDELTEMYEAALREGGGINGPSRRMYDRMRELEDACLLADGWERTGPGSWRRPHAATP